MTRKRFFYHLSDVDHGPVLATTKRPPKCRAPSEPDVPRLCVAPFSTWDAFLTEERWMWHPAELERIGYLHQTYVALAQLPLHRFHKHGWKSDYKVRIAALKLSWDTIGFMYPNKHIVDGLASKFLQVPPDQFLVEECERRYAKHPERRIPGELAAGLHSQD